MDKHVLITGASGFLGSRISALAREAGWEVCGYDRKPCPATAESFVGDIGDAAMLEKACRGMTALVHAAGLAHVSGRGTANALRFKTINEDGTAYAVDAALKCGIPHIVLVSSVSVYGLYDGEKCDESMPCFPKTPYAVSKREGELRAIERAAQAGISLTVLRFATIYGEGDPGNVSKLIKTLDKKRFIWPGPGETQKSLIHRDDAARACVCALEHPHAGTEVFNVSSPAVTMKEIVTSICHALHRPVPRVAIPLALLKAGGAFLRRMGDPGNLAENLKKFTRDDVYDAAKFASAFSFVPEISLKDGIQKEVSFLRASGVR
jgi:nucleoside-diphosphate-sugar epimerase